MRNRAKILAAVTFLSAGLVAFGFGVAQAQPDQPKGGAPVTGTVQGNVSMTSDEISKAAEKVQAQLEMTRSQVQSMLNKAYEKDDAVKIDCVNEKLNVVDKRVQTARETMSKLQVALRNQDTQQGSIYLQVMQNHQNESNKAKSEAELCIGSDLGILGESSTTTTVDPGVPTEPVQPPFVLLPSNPFFEPTIPQESSSDLLCRTLTRVALFGLA